jgi:hypothetical protein
LDLASGRVTGGLTPSTEVGARFDTGATLAPFWGKSVYDVRQDILDLRPTGSTTPVARGVIVSLVLKNTSNWEILGTRFWTTWDGTATEGIYARDAAGARIADEVIPFDPDTVTPSDAGNNGRRFLVANDSSQTAPPDFAYTQSTELSTAGCYNFTQLDPTGKVGVWRFIEVPPASSDTTPGYGPLFQDAGGFRWQPSDVDPVALAMVMAVPEGARALHVGGTLYADAAIRSPDGVVGTDITTDLANAPVTTDSPAGVARDTAGLVYVTHGTQVRRFTTDADGAYVLDNAALLDPSASRVGLGHIAVSTHYSRIYIVESGRVLVYDLTVSPPNEVYILPVTNAFGVAIYDGGASNADNRLYVSVNSRTTADDGQVRAYTLTAQGIPTSATPSATQAADLGWGGGAAATEPAYRSGGQLAVDSLGRIYVAANENGIYRYPAQLSGAADQTFQTPAVAPWAAGRFCQLAVLSDTTVLGFDRAGIVPDAVVTDAVPPTVGDNGPLMIFRVAPVGPPTYPVPRGGLVKFTEAADTTISVTSASSLWTYGGAVPVQLITVNLTKGPVALATAGAGTVDAVRAVVLENDPLPDGTAGANLYTVEM